MTLIVDLIYCIVYFKKIVNNIIKGERSDTLVHFYILKGVKNKYGQ